MYDLCLINRLWKTSWKSLMMCKFGQQMLPEMTLLSEFYNLLIASYSEVCLVTQ